MVAFDLTTRLIILLLAFQSLDQGLGQENALVCRHLFQRSQPLLHGRKVMRSQMERTFDGEPKMPRFRSLLLALTWP